MIGLIQRVTSAKVEIEGNIVGQIGHGLLLLVGVERGDGAREADRLLDRVVTYRVFDDHEGKMNRSLIDIGGEALVVSQFTLYADTSRGNRPSFTVAAPPAIAVPLYESFCRQLSGELGKPVAAGRFGADMQVHLINDGPVTIWLEV